MVIGQPVGQWDGFLPPERHQGAWLELSPTIQHEGGVHHEDYADYIALVNP